MLFMMNAFIHYSDRIVNTVRTEFKQSSVIDLMQKGTQDATNLLNEIGITDSASLLFMNRHRYRVSAFHAFLKTINTISIDNGKMFAYSIVLMYQCNHALASMQQSNPLLCRVLYNYWMLLLPFTMRSTKGFSC